MSKLHIAQECSQKWYRINSWFPWTMSLKVRNLPWSDGKPRTSGRWRRKFAGFRRLQNGFAFGPIMFWWGDDE